MQAPHILTAKTLMTAISELRRHFPEPDELALATELFVLCVKLVSVEKMLGDM